MYGRKTKTTPAANYYDALQREAVTATASLGLLAKSIESHSAHGLKGAAALELMRTLSQCGFGREDLDRMCAISADLRAAKGNDKERARVLDQMLADPVLCSTAHMTMQREKKQREDDEKAAADARRIAENRERVEAEREKYARAFAGQVVCA